MKLESSICSKTRSVFFLKKEEKSSLDPHARNEEFFFVLYCHLHSNQIQVKPIFNFAVNRGEK